MRIVIGARHSGPKFGSIQPYRLSASKYPSILDKSKTRITGYRYARISMSGIEVAGLVLGAVPILIKAIDSYKSGIKKLKSGFKKRKVIEKLGRALRYQKSIIETITRNVLVQSGCDNAAGANDAQLRTLLQDKQIQEMVDDFLGADNAQVFSDALVDCMADISHATIGLASLVPALALVKVMFPRLSIESLTNHRTILTSKLS